MRGARRRAPLPAPLLRCTAALHANGPVPARPHAPGPNPPLQAWDLKSGALLRTQTVHRGMVTAVVFAPSARLLFSAGIDGAVGIWTDKGTLLQVRLFTKLKYTTLRL